MGLERAGMCEVRSRGQRIVRNGPPARMAGTLRGWKKKRTQTDILSGTSRKKKKKKKPSLANMLTSAVSPMMVRE